MNRLVEDAELVANPVADGGDVKRRQRVHVARRQTAESTVAQTRLLLLFQNGAEVLPETRQGFLRRFPHTEIDQAVAEVRSGQEFSREVGNDLGRIMAGDRLG